MAPEHVALGIFLFHAAESAAKEAVAVDDGFGFSEPDEVSDLTQKSAFYREIDLQSLRS